jgi:hypothetical protein
LCAVVLSAGRGVVLLCFVIGEEFAARGMTRRDKGRKFEFLVMMTGTEAQQLLCVTFF